MLKLKELRENKNLLQKDLAKILNKTVACISLWEKEKTEPSIADLCAIANYFGVTIDSLLGRENEITGIVEIEGEILSEDEKQLLIVYRTLNSKNKSQTIGFAKGLYSNQ